MHYWLKITNILNSLFSTKQASFSNRWKFPSKWHLFSSQAACFVSFTNFLLTFVGQGTGVAAMMYTMSSSFHKRHNLFRRCSAGMPTCQVKMLHMGGQMGTHTLTSRPTLIQLHHGWSIIGVHNQVGLSDCSAGTYTCFGFRTVCLSQWQSRLQCRSRVHHILWQIVPTILTWKEPTDFYLTLCSNPYFCFALLCKTKESISIWCSPSVTILTGTIRSLLNFLSDKLDEVTHFNLT